MIPFKKLNKYISRRSHIRLLRHWSYKVADEAACYALYFEAEGGLGKTRLLEMYPTFIGKKIPELLIANIIDLYDYANRNPNEIEQKLIDGLKKTNQGQWYREPSEYIDQIFEDYNELARKQGTPDTAQNVDDKLREQFIKCWNKLAKEHTIVMRFDTVETLFGQPSPEGALVKMAELHSSAILVNGWIKQVLPRLHHTLVLFSGRPIKSAPNLLVRQLDEINVLKEAPQTLHPLAELGEIEAFLAEYKLPLEPHDLRHIQRITEGRPLLLTCYAEICRGTIPISEEKKETLSRLLNKNDFESFVIETILNPIAIKEPYGRTLALCLYFLSYARYGIRMDELSKLFDDLDIPKDAAVFNSLHEVALIRRVRSKNTKTSILEETEDQTRDTLLILHDEIYRLIDEGKKLDSLDLRNAVLVLLCKRSKEQVSQAVRHRTAVLRAMSEHMCYELARDFTNTGYKSYTIYFDWFLRQRSIIAAGILAEAFWAMFNTSVTISGQVIYPFRQKIKESNELTIDVILNHERVRFIKLLRAQDKYQESLNKADELYSSSIERGLIPEDGATLALHYDFYLFVEINLERAIGLMTLLCPGYEQDVESICDGLIRLLTRRDIDKERFFNRRKFFLGQIYLLRSQLYTHQQSFKEAISAALVARRSFLEYHIQTQRLDIIPEDVRTDLGQVINHLALNLVEIGRLDEAQQLAEDVVRFYAKHALDYRQTLFYVTYMRILLRHGDASTAEEMLQQAETAAEHSSSDRAHGLVQFARGILQRRQMNISGRADHSGIECFKQAEQLLQREPTLYREIHYEWTRYLRDLAWIYGSNNETRRQYEYQQRAIQQADKTLALLPANLLMQRSDLLETKASVYNNVRDFAAAIALLHEAAELLQDDMPPYAHVVAGKIALQQGLIAFYHQRDEIRALQFMAIALARAYFFAPQHRDQAALEQIIRQSVKKILPAALQTFLDSKWQIEPSHLPHPVLEANQWDRWSASFQQSFEFFKDLLREITQPAQAH